MPAEHTLVLVKPDGVRRDLIGEILARFEQADLSVTALELRHPDHDLAARHYNDHVEKDFYDNLIRYLSSAPVVAAILTGDDAVSTARDVIGETDPATAGADTIRGALGTDSMKRADQEDRALHNLVHASEHKDAAERELGLWFPDLADDLQGQLQPS